MAAVAISWLAIELSRGRDTGLLVGAAVAAYTVPGVVAGLGLGRVLTRWDPRLLVLAEAALRAVSLGLVAAGAAARLLTPAWYVALLGVSSLLGLLGVTGAVASVAELLPEAQRVAGNSLITLTSFAATIIGPGLAGLVIATAGADVAFWTDALSYLVLVVAVLISRRVQRPTWPGYCTPGPACSAATGPCSASARPPARSARPGSSASACGGWPSRSSQAGECA
jgi:MFS family permease